MGLSLNRFSAIGLDVGSRWVKAAQLERSASPSGSSPARPFRALRRILARIR